MAAEVDATRRAPDHLDQIYREGDLYSSSGNYAPLDGYRLHLAGDDGVVNDLTHLHEIAHKQLADDTSWGIACHIAARHHELAATLYPDMVDAARVTQEAFAYVFSLQLAEAGHGSTIDVAATYPETRLYGDRLARLLIPVEGTHRRDLAAIGVARFCMNTPILERMRAALPDALTLATVPSVDWPDYRFAQLMGVPAAGVISAVQAADAAYADKVGGNVDDLSLESTDRSLDTAWAAWEDVFIRELVSLAPRLTGVRVRGHFEHVTAGHALLDAISSDGTVVDLVLPEESRASDGEVAESTLAAGAIELPARGMVSRWGFVDVWIDLAGQFAGERPVVVHGRRADRLRQQYSFDEEGSPRLFGLGSEVVFSTRLVLGADADRWLLHAALPEPEDYRQLVAARSDAGAVANCVTASCFVETDWQRSWWPELSGRPTVVLLDTGIRSLLGPGHLLGTDQTVWAQRIGLDHPFLTAIVWAADGQAHVNLALGNQLTVNLVKTQLEAFLGARLASEESDWTAWLGTLEAVISSLVQTEASLNF